VARILTARWSELRDPSRWRVARLSARTASWAWGLGEGHTLWGATAIATAVLLGLVDPEWSDGTDPAALPADREVRPWEHLPAGASSRRARLPDVPARGAEELPGLPPLDDAAALVARAGEVVADAVEGLGPAGGRVLVLAGPGWTGTVGLAAAATLADRGADVAALEPPGPLEAGASSSPVRVDLVDRLGGRLRTLDEALPEADLIVDAIAGRGLDGQLRPPLLDLVLALRTTAAPVVSIDLPSGVHPARGLVGDAVSADVTLALGSPAAGLFASGLAPFVGDLYLVELGAEADAEPLVRVLPDTPTGGWRE
jgi:hydroxyethylthiazole kinase-like uncharacterized protein yjeF